MKLNMKFILKNILIGLTLIVCQRAFAMEKSLNDQLFDAAREGDVQKVRRLLVQGANVNYNRLHAGTPLRLALRGGYRPYNNNYVETVKLLLSNNADPNLKVYEGILFGGGAHTVLGELIGSTLPEGFRLNYSYRIDTVYQQLLKLLLVYGADPLLESDNLTGYSSPLHAANNQHAMIMVTTISNADAKRIRKHITAATLALKTKQKWAPKDVQKIILQKVFDNVVIERMKRAEDMLKRAHRSSDAEIVRNMIEAEMKRILYCTENEYSSEDPSAWEPEFCTIL